MMPFYTGIVEDRNDPLEMGRVRVRVFSIHTDSKTDIPTASLPWAQVIQPANSAATSGIGFTTLGPVNGTTVIITFADGDMQQPIVMGTLAGNVTPHYKIIDGQPVSRNPQKGFNDPSDRYPYTSYHGETDVHKLARTRTENQDPIIQQRFNSRNVSVPTAAPAPGTWDEPVSGLGQSQYPLNHVRSSEAGHLEEWDDTENNNRIHTKHAAGTYTEIIHDGTRTTKIVGSDFLVCLQDNNVLVSGSCNITVSGGAKLKIEGNYDVEVGGDHNITVAGNETRTIGGAETVNVGSTRDHTSGGNTTIIAPKIDLNP